MATRSGASGAGLMLTPCKGAPSKEAHYGGAWGQLQKLRKGRHPKTGELLPDAVREDGTAVRPTGIYSRLPAYRGASVAEAVAASVPVVTVHRSGTSASDKMHARLLRIRAKEAAAQVQLLPVTRFVRQRLSVKSSAAKIFREVPFRS